MSSRWLGSATVLGIDLHVVAANGSLKIKHGEAEPVLGVYKYRRR